MFNRYYTAAFMLSACSGFMKDNRSIHLLLETQENNYVGIIFI